MKPLISILLPSIRKNNLFKFVESVEKSCSHPFEIIIVSPYPLPGELWNKPEIKFISSFRSPAAAQQIAACNAEGDVLVNGCDDGLFVPGQIDKAFEYLISLPQEYGIRNIVVTKYHEGGEVQGDWYYQYRNAYPQSPMINGNWWIFNSVLIYRQYYEFLGGLNCQYQCTCIATADLGCRAYHEGANVQLYSESIIDCGHMPGQSGDHGPIDITQREHDMPRFTACYNHVDCYKNIHVSMNNWKKTAPIWKARFNEL